MMIKMKSELATKWVDKDSAQAKRELSEILDTTRTALKQVRELVSDMKFISAKRAGAFSQAAAYSRNIAEHRESGEAPAVIQRGRNDACALHPGSHDQYYQA